jgi:hypothetical protein
MVEEGVNRIKGTSENKARGETAEIKKGRAKVTFQGELKRKSRMPQYIGISLMFLIREVS